MSISRIFAHFRGQPEQVEEEKPIISRLGFKPQIFWVHPDDYFALFTYSEKLKELRLERINQEIIDFVEKEDI